MNLVEFVFTGRWSKRAIIVLLLLLATATQAFKTSGPLTAQSGSANAYTFPSEIGTAGQILKVSNGDNSQLEWAEANPPAYLMTNKILNGGLNNTDYYHNGFSYITCSDQRYSYLVCDISQDATLKICVDSQLFRFSSFDPTRATVTINGGTGQVIMGQMASNAYSGTTNVATFTSCNVFRFASGDNFIVSGATGSVRSSIMRTTQRVGVFIEEYEHIADLSNPSF